jgi:peptidylprolyl isomerase
MEENQNVINNTIKINTNKTYTYLIIGILIIAAIFLVYKNTMEENTQDNTITEDKQVKLTTSKGEIIIELYSKDMPITAGNFEKLVGEEFYDGTIFHRVIDEFMIQGGDPQGTGMGGPGYEIKDEFTQTSLDQNMRGTISMANAGPNTGGSQFFINLVDNNFLDGKHPVFGKVTEGIDIVDAIAKVEKNAQDKPLEEIRIIKAEII